MTRVNRSYSMSGARSSRADNDEAEVEAGGADVTPGLYEALRLMDEAQALWPREDPPYFAATNAVVAALASREGTGINEVARRLVELRTASEERDIGTDAAPRPVVDEFTPFDSRAHRSRQGGNVTKDNATEEATGGWSPEADFDSLQLGQSYTSPPRPIRQSDISLFAVLSGDHHPLHTDPAWAATGPFGEPIAHGLLVLSCASGTIPLDPNRVVALRRIREVVFKRPLAAGEAIVVESRITALRVIDAGTGLVECQWRIRGEDGRLRVRATVEILWRRDPQGDAPEASGETTTNSEPAAPTSSVDEVDELAPVEVTEDGLRVLV